MAEKVGSLLIDLAANVARLQQDMNKATGVVTNATEKMAKAWEGFSSLVKAGLAFEALREVVKAAKEGEDSINRLSAAFAHQGDQAGITRKELEDLADEMSRASQFKDSDFRNAEATLLSFGNIYGDVFKRALQLSTDLGAKTGDLAGATQTWGQALSNPIEGLKQLGNAIGKTTPEQREMIKNLVQTNDVIGAQNFLLDMAQKKIGGTAQIMNSGYTQAINDAAKAWDRFKEALGNIPLLKDAVIAALEAIAKTLQGLSGVVEGKSFSAGFLGDRLAMAKQITELEDQIATSKKRQGLVFTDDQGRVIGEENHLDDLEAKLKTLKETYDRLYQSQEKIKGAKPNFGMTQEQIDFLKQLKRQNESIGEGPTGGLSAKAKELSLSSSKIGLPSGTDLKIQALGQALQKEADEAANAALAFTNWKKAHDFSDDLTQQTKDLDLQTQHLGTNAEEQTLLTAKLKLANDERAISRDLIGQEREAFISQAATIETKYIAAVRKNIEVSRQWQTGVKQAFSDLSDQAADKATQAKNAVVNAFQGMEDALVKFAQTGKLNFNDLANSIIADLIRIQIKQNLLGPIANGLGISFAGAFGGGAGAAGGTGFVQLATGTNYVPQDMFAMIHKGEAVVPKEFNDGGNGGSGAGVVINQSIHVDSRSDFQSVISAMNNAKAQAKAEILNSIARNGQFAGAIRSVR